MECERSVKTIIRRKLDCQGKTEKMYNSKGKGNYNISNSVSLQGFHCSSCQIYVVMVQPF